MHGCHSVRDKIILERTAARKCTIPAVLFVMYHMHTPPWYTNNLSMLAGNGEKMPQSRYVGIFACKL